MTAPDARSDTAAGQASYPEQHDGETISLRDRVRAMLGAGPSARREVDLIFTHTELCFAHGTGILMSRVLGEAPPYVLFRSFDNWGGANAVEPVADHVFHQFSQDRQTIAEFVAARLLRYRPRRIVAVPYTREDVIMALTAKVMTGVPLTIWLMDDNTLLHRGIPESEFRELVRAADARFAISEDIADAYQAAFGETFWILPPLVAGHLMLPEPSALPAAEPGMPTKAVIVGNIWHQGWLDDLLSALQGSGLEVDWFTSADDLHFLRIDAGRLAAAGVTIRSGVPHADIARAAAAAAIVLAPSTNLSETDGHAAAIGRLSLPSKLPFVAAAAGTPILVLANGESGAARFVARFGLGEEVRYDPGLLRTAVARLIDPSTQRRIRQASYTLARELDVAGSYDLLTRSAQEGRLVDDRFERLFGRA